MNPAWKSILDTLKRIKKITPEEEAKLVAVFSKGGNVRDVADDFLTGIGDKVRGGAKAAFWKKGRGPEAVIGAAKATSRTTAAAAKAARAVKGAVSGLRGAATGVGAAGTAAADTASTIAGGLGTAASSVGRGLGAAWRMSRPWMGVAGKGALLGLGGLGALYTLLELPGMVSDGLDIAEDAGLDPRGRKQPLKAALQNRLAMQGAEGMEGAGENEMLERVSGTLGRMEGMHETGASYGALPEAAEAKMGVLRELPFLAAHQDELMAIQKKAAMQDSFEAAAMRLLGR